MAEPDGHHTEDGSGIGPRRRIAIVGSGIAGLTCAHLLDELHEVTLFEADARLGGHTNTVTVDDPDAGPLGVDTGFIVHNDRNYPNLIRLFDRLGVATQESEMSFSVTDAGGFTYRATNVATLLARPANVVDRRWWRMMADIVRFYRAGNRFLDRPDPTLTIGQFLADGRYSASFVDLHLLPMGAAVWSTSPADFEDFPAQALLTFLRNHGLLSIGDRPQWRTVTGGSRTYVEAIADRFSGTVRADTPVLRVARRRSGAATAVEVTTATGTDRFDAVVLACHSDQARALIADRSGPEEEILGAIRYRENDAVLHTDTTVLSPARRAWAAWNYHAGPNRSEPSLTYDLTTLQRLPGRHRYLVTLNPDPARPPSGQIARFRYAHPQFDTAAIRAQDRVEEIDGVDGLYFCGAYWRYGFHEDGLVSALRVCRKLGARW
ncbi:MAG: FAD-dependent oxidoreductase [Actinomycetota bacterium]